MVSRWSAGRRRPLRTGAERLASVPGGPIARLAQRRPRKPPGASRRSIPSHGEGRKKGKDAPASIKIGPAELWQLQIKETEDHCTSGNSLSR